MIEDKLTKIIELLRLILAKLSEDEWLNLTYDPPYFDVDTGEESFEKSDDPI